MSKPPSTEILLASHSSRDAATGRLHFPNGYLLLDFYQDGLDIIERFICVGDIAR
jgi:hypothetical protein